MPVGQRHAIPGDDATVGVEFVGSAGATGGDDHRFGLDHAGHAILDVEADHALNPPIFDQQVETEMLVETFDRRVLDGGLEQGVQHVEAGLVGGKPGPRNLHPTEGANVHLAIGLAAPRATPVFQLHQLFGAVFDKVLHDVLLTEPVAARDGVVKVIFQAVVIAHDTGGSAFGGHCMAAHRVDLGYQGNLEGWIGLGDGDGGS